MSLKGYGRNRFTARIGLAQEAPEELRFPAKMAGSGRLGEGFLTGRNRCMEEPLARVHRGIFCWMHPSKARRWYQIAVSYIRSSELLQREVPFSKGKRSTLCSIAGLPPVLAQQLEAAGLSWRGWQRVAHADGAAAQHARAESELAKIAARHHGNEKRDPGAEANELLEGGPVPPDYRRPPVLTTRAPRKTRPRKGRPLSKAA
jgi:hypothetical protein